MHVDKWLRAGNICVMSTQLVCAKECIPEHEQISISYMMAACFTGAVVNMESCLQQQQQQQQKQQEQRCKFCSMVKGSTAVKRSSRSKQCQPQSNRQLVKNVACMTTAQASTGKCISIAKAALAACYLRSTGCSTALCSPAPVHIAWRVGTAQT